MEPLPHEAEAVVQFAEKPYTQHEFRYWHTHRPHWIEIPDLLTAGASVLVAATPAVAKQHSSSNADTEAKLMSRMLGLARGLRQ